MQVLLITLTTTIFLSVSIMLVVSETDIIEIAKTIAYQLTQILRLQSQNITDIQYHGHASYDNNELIYWKETKNFANGCSAHITGG